jgi:hypothetical protein
LFALLVITAVALPLAAFAAPAAAAGSCHGWNGGGSRSLQQAVTTYACVQVQPGTWHVTAGVALPAGHTLTGRAGSAKQTIIVADAPGAWGCCNGIVNVGPKNPLSVSNAVIAHLTLQSARHSMIGITGALFTAQDVRILGAICNGMSVYGPRAVIENSYFYGNGFGSACPNSPPGAGIYVHVVPTDPSGGPVVKGSTFVHNGPAIDVDSVSGGVIANNHFSGNDGWAAIALYRGANWMITNNTIQQPRTASRGDQPGGNFSYQAACQTGPSGAHPAAIWLCENSNAGGLVADHNTISGNALGSYYGVLLMGADDPNEGGAADVTPRFNIITGNNLAAASLGGSVVPGADDYSPGQSASGVDSWINNTCGQTACGPVYF